MKNSDLKISNALGVDFETLPLVVIDKVDVTEKNEINIKKCNQRQKNVIDIIQSYKNSNFKIFELQKIFYIL